MKKGKKLKENNNPPLVLLEWEDSAQPKPAWMFLSDFEAPNIVKCASVGWLINDGKDVKVLAPNIGNYDDTGGGEQASGIICIAARCVTRLVNLKEAK